MCVQVPLKHAWSIMCALHVPSNLRVRAVVHTKADSWGFQRGILKNINPVTHFGGAEKIIILVWSN